MGLDSYEICRVCTAAMTYKWSVWTVEMVLESYETSLGGIYINMSCGRLWADLEGHWLLKLPDWETPAPQIVSLSTYKSPFINKITSVFLYLL